MIHSKHLNKIVALLVCLSLLVCGLIAYFAGIHTGTKVTEYASKLFGDEILTIDIRVDETEWQEMLDNATAKEYISADLVINGELFSTVGLRTKGNSSLTQVAQMEDSDRYSLQFKFNHFQKGQTCYGLDAFCVNNLVGDATYMKDYISYEIMKSAGVPTPLMNYASVTVNGEDYGFCLAMERYEKSFLDRVYDTSGGQLYNVKIQMGQRENFMNDNAGQEDDLPQVPAEEANGWQNGGGRTRPNFNSGGGAQNNGGMPMESTEPPATDGTDSGQATPDQNQTQQENPQGGMGGFPEGGRGGMGGGRGGGDLVYVDDNVSSYSSIFDNAEFQKISDQEKQRVITAIQNLNEGNNLEQYFDVDAILRYLAAHTVVVNLDSYSSNMAQNYYLYERDGKITLLPWDYGLSFGGFQSGSANNVVNFPIDTPVSGVSMEERPLINKLLEVPEYKEKYHEYLQQIVDEYFISGQFAATVMALDGKINDYVKNDATSFTTYEAYEASLPVLIELGTLRAQSIEGQLNGSIPSTSEEQNANPDALVDASGINLSALGSMMGGGGFGGNRGQQEEQGGFGAPGDMPDMSLLQQAMPILQESGGVLTEEVREQLLALGLTEEQIEQIVKMSNRMQGGGFGSQSDTEEQGGFPGGQGGFPGGQGGFPGSQNGQNNQTEQGSAPDGQEVQGDQSEQGNFPVGNSQRGQESKVSANVLDPAYLIAVAMSLLVLGAATFFLFKAKKTY